MVCRSSKAHPPVRVAFFNTYRKKGKELQMQHVNLMTAWAVHELWYTVH